MNYSELVTHIQDAIQDFGTSFVAHIPDFVKAAEDKILHGIELPAFTKNATSTTTQSDQYLQLPNDYIAPRELAVVTGGQHTYLLQKDTSFIREMYPSVTTEGLPKFYALFDHNTALLGPTPDAAYSVELHYFYRPTSIVTASTTWIGDNLPQALLYGSLIEAYVYDKGDPDMVQVYEKMFQDALMRAKVLGVGKLRTDNYRTPKVQTAGP